MTDKTEDKTEQERFVPQAALEDERHKRQRLETELAELRGTVKALASQPQAPRKEERALSAADLRQAVDEGRMTESQADEIRERQMETRVRSRVSEELRSEISNTDAVKRIGENLQAYKDAIPELVDRDSREFAKAKAEFDYLVSLGHDANDPRTELTAARAAFGDPSKYRKINPGAPDPHQETGGPGADTDGRTSDNSPKGLTARQREFYRGQIEKGIYSDWSDPTLKKELEFVNPGVAKRAQERVA